ncbi:conserved hypothetical protein, membrane [Candidatus Magnetomorum sp. HK-1]|nr:conserved hypothetical protein, membrane [Candidatus Magnetomorum sp. HK-1]
MKRYILAIFAVLTVACSSYASDVDNRLILEKLNSIENRLNGIDSRLNGIDRRIDDIKQHLNQRIDDLNKRIDDVNKRLDDSRAYDLALIIAILSLIAMILWDRRTALKPINEQINELKKRLDYMWEHFRFDKKISVITS